MSIKRTNTKLNKSFTKNVEIIKINIYLLKLTLTYRILLFIYKMKKLLITFALLYLNNMYTAGRYESQNRKILPPGCQRNAIQYTLALQLLTVHIFAMAPKPTLCKITLWGQTIEHKLQNGSPIIFDVHTSTVLFKDYLKDMRVTKVKLCDSRNGQQLGSGFINWSLYLTQQSKNKVFFDNCFQITVPVGSNKKKNVAQIRIKIQWKEAKQQQIKDRNRWLKYPQQQNLDAQPFEYGNKKRKQEDCKIINKSSNAGLAKKKQQSDKNKMVRNMKGFDVKQSQSINFLLDNEDDQDQIFLKNETNNARKRIEKSKKTKQILEQIEKYDPKSSYPESRYELEKAKLRLEAQQFLTLTKNSYRQNPMTAGEKPCIFTLSNLVFLKQNINYEYLQVFIVSKNGYQKEEKKHLRIFPNAKDGKIFTDLSIRNGDLVELQIGKNMAKAKFQQKSIKELVTKIFFYNKTGKFASLDVYRNQQMLSPKVEQLKENMNKRITIDSSIKDEKKQTQNINILYLFVIVEDASNKSTTNPRIFIKDFEFLAPFPSSNIIPLSMVGSLCALQLRNSNNETIDSFQIEGYSKTPYIPQNLGCIILINKVLQTKSSTVYLKVMVGSINQINYENSRINSSLNRIKQRKQKFQNRGHQFDPNYKDYHNKEGQGRNEVYEKMEINYGSIQKSRPTIKKQITENSEAKDDFNHQYKKFNHRRQNKKVYTQVVQDQRVATQSAFQFKNNQQDLDDQEPAEPQEEVFLLQILSKFLHALPADKFGETPPSSIPDFVALLNHFLGVREEKQLIDLVMDMFVDDTGIEEGQSSRLDYHQFLKCLKGYHNFLQLWLKIKADLLTELAKFQPQYEKRINKYSELGTITKQILWNKVFPNIDNTNFKLQIDKVMKLAPSVPISSQLFIEEIKRVQNNPNQYPKEANPDLIMDLSKLIKETTESILQTTQTNVPDIAEDKVNIRIFCDIMDSIGIGLSYWQSLMLIQQLKGWYGVDLYMNEGVISASVVEVWLKSVTNRSKIFTKVKQSESKNEKKQKISMEIAIPSKGEVYKPSEKIEQNASHKVSRTQTNRLMENKSMAKSQLNEQEIENIANLLRQNENFRLGTVISEKNTNSEYQVNKRNENKNILNKQQLGLSSEQESGSIDLPKKLQPTKYLQVKVKSIKIKTELVFPVKFVIKMAGRQSYSFCYSLQQFVQKTLVSQLHSGWDTKTKGLQFQIFQLNINSLQSQKGQLLMSGVLISDEISSLKLNTPKTKTIIIYSKKQIVGKIILDLSLTNDKPKEESQNRQTQISIQINCSNNTILKDSKVLKVRILNIFEGLTSLSPRSANSSQQIYVEPKKWTKVSVPETFYQNMLSIILEEIGETVIPLQQLYFKDQLAGQYPIVAEDGIFQGNIEVKMQNEKNKVHKVSDQFVKSPNLSLQKDEKTSSAKARKFLIIFDQLITISSKIPSSSEIQFFANLFIKDTYNRTILFRSPFYVEHNHGHTVSQTLFSEFSEENFCIIEQQGQRKIRSITIELQYQGRPIAQGITIINLDSIQKNPLFMYQMKYLGRYGQKIQMGLSLRISQITQSFSKYNPVRIIKALSNFPPINKLSSTEQIVSQICSSPKRKLTITQQRMLEQFLKLNPGVIPFVFDIQEREFTILINQLLQNDPNCTGRIQMQILQQILRNVGSEGKKIFEKLRRQWKSQGTHDSCRYIGIFSLIRFSSTHKQRASSDQIGRDVISSVDKLYRQVKSKYQLK